MIPVPSEETAFRRLDDPDHPLTEFDDVSKSLRIRPEALTLLAREAFRDVNFLLRTSRLEQVAGILRDPDASQGDRMVARMALENAAIAAGFQLPLCQDTGVATVFGWKGEECRTGADDAAALSEGVRQTYAAENLRHSIQVPRTTLDEANSRTNLPALVKLSAVQGGEYRFLFVAKGGGSSNKTRLFQESPALLRLDRLVPFVVEKVRELGTSACPPYRVAVAIGGLSPESALEGAKLLSCGALDSLPFSCGDGDAKSAAGAFRDGEMEAEILEATRRFGIGAQLPGRSFALDVRVMRLPRHSASLPVALAVSCLADRQAWGRIDRNGVWLESLERHPERFLPDETHGPDGRTSPLSSPAVGEDAVDVDLDQPMDAVRRALSLHPVGTRLRLTGTLLVARDLAHARIRRMVEAGEEPPREFFNHPVYYAGPARTPEGMPCGSFGPTTAGRMDADLPFFQERGACLVTLAKGNRSAAVKESCRRHGGFYLGTVGGTAALIAHDCILSSKVIAFPELGMEAVREIRVRNLPAFIVMDDKGNDLYGAR